MDNKKACEKIFGTLDVDHEKYRFGHTKIFFRAGFLAVLEELRDDKLASIFIGVQARIRVKLEKTEFVRRLERREASRIIQSNIRAFLYVRDWEWMKIMYKIEALKKAHEKESSRRKELEESQVSLVQEKNDLVLKLQYEEDSLADAEDRCDQLIRNKIDL